MKPVANDLLPSEIEVLRTRRRTVELSLEHGQLVARIPRRFPQSEVEPLLAHLRADLWNSLRRRLILDDPALAKRAADVARRCLPALDLPPYEVRFSRRQRKRWGSCTVSEGRGRVRISAALIGHPTWVLDHVLLHELIHLRIPNHGDAFHRLLDADPRRERAEGYLEALENTERMGTEMRDRLRATVTAPVERDNGSPEELPLFDNLDQSALSARTANPSLPVDS